MEAIQSDNGAQGYAATVGFFDGVHRGHQSLVSQLKQQAGARGLATMVVTFGQHPRRVVSPDYQPRLLSTLQEKLDLLRQLGIDRVEVLPFDQQMAALTARQFMQQVLLQKLGVRLLLTGYDNHFGHRDAAHRHEGFADYVGYGQELGMHVVAGQPLALEPEVNASSSLARQRLLQGDVEGARRCLGRRYRLQGRVVGGEHIGHTLGFPTANLQPGDDDKLVPAVGVYAVLAQTGADVRPAMMNIGTRPTFDGTRQTMEVHVLDFDGDLYGQEMGVQFVARLRGEQRFSSADDLRAQLELDARQVRELMKNLKE